MKTDNEILQDLIEIIHFTETVSTKIRGLLDEPEVYRAVKEEFVRSAKYTMSILLLTDEGSKLRIAETSLDTEKRKAGEKISGVRLKEYRIDLNKSSIYRRVVKEEETIVTSISETINELFTPPVAHLLSKILGYRKKSILTPLYKQGKIIGVLSISSTDLYKHLIPSVKNLAQHISNALELAHGRSEREKEVKEALRKSENLLSSIIEQSPFSTWIADANGTNIKQNAACRKLFGIDCDQQTAGKYNIFSDHVVKEQGLTQELRKVFDEGETVTLTVDYDFSRVKNVNVPNATHKILKVTIFPVKDENGKVINAVVQHEDISQQKKAEEERNKLLKAIETSREAINIASPKAVMIYTNDAMDKLFGYKKGELIGQHASVLNAGATPETVTKRIANAIEREGYWEGEINNKRKDGTEFISYARISALRDRQGKIINFVSTQHDITERKKAEKEREKLQVQLIQSAKMATVGILASGIAHEFNNLLQIMSGHVEFARKTRKPKSTEKALDIYLENSNKAAKIIKDLLTFSRQEVCEKELCDITEPIETVLSLTENQLKNYSIRVVKKYEKTPMVKVNKGEMQQVFLDIIVNARDAMLPNGGKLEICVRKVSENVEVSFSDTGKGIEEENLSKVFEPFYTTKGALGGSTVPGTGLGLSVSYGIVQRHRGAIEVNSQVGRGSTFTVKLPVKEVGTRVKVVKKQKKKENKNIQVMNILVVDDEREICKILADWLSIDGHRVKSVLTGRKAIELVKDEYFDVVFLDIIMPGISSLMVLDEIKKVSPETKVLMITGKLMNDYLLSELKQKGASGCIQKPFGIEKIKEALA